MSSRKLPVVDSNMAQRAAANAAGTGLSRRSFVRVLSTAMAAAGLEACNKAPQEDIIPYVQRPPEVVPGVARFYATCTEREGYGMGLLAESHAGRPTKLEGHPDHPASSGATLAQEQAEVLTLYDPDRAKAVWRRGSIQSYRAFVRALQKPQQGMLRASGKGTHILLEPTASPLIASLIDGISRQLPEARVHLNPSRAPISRWRASKKVLGGIYDTHFDFRNAKRIVDLGANFLGGMPMSIRWARDFAEGRDIAEPHGHMNRLYCVESAMTITGSTADHRLAVPASQIGDVAAALLAAVSNHIEGSVPRTVVEQAKSILERMSDHRKKWIEALAKDLSDHRGATAVVVGDRQPEHVHAIAYGLNAALASTSQLVSYAPATLIKAEEHERAYDIQSLLRSLDANQVDSLFVLGGNPAYGLPADLQWRRRSLKAKERVYLSLYENETAEDATWFIPQAHFLESWGDSRAYDGTVSFRQPLIRPLYDGKSVEELLAAMAGSEKSDARWTLREHWLANLGSEERFTEALARGLLPATAVSSGTVSPNWKEVAKATQKLQHRKKHKLELNIAPDPRIEDGSLANNAWLQETPEPITKLVWGNAVLMNPKTAKQHGLERGDVVELRHGSHKIEAPILPEPGQAEQALSIWLGYGRAGKESVAHGVGVNVAPLRFTRSPWVTEGITVHKTGRHHELVTTQDTFDMHERDIALHQSKHHWQKQPKHFQHHDEPPPTTLPDRLSGEPQWGMSIDLNRCTGCSSCVTACIAENNIPVVGKDMVAMGREMLWMRIDTYHAEHDHHDKALMQPMLCQHCEKAPCEYVCPVNATVHSDDGLNEMIYNRCVGTRFCSNNCPYKVRRFNWYDFNDNVPEPKAAVHNPDVTVRARGVMEKCTFCVQRIRRAQIDAKLEERPLRDGDVTTACAQACPTNAIVFGLVSDHDSKVSRLHRSLRAYGCLSGLGTRPRVRYLGRIYNHAKEMQG